MHIHCLQHVAHEGPANIAHWAKRAGHALTVGLMGRDTLTQSQDYDALIVLGGPMGAYDDAVYDWMTPEKRQIEAAIKSDKHVLGICLGSQLIASVLGARVYKHTEREIGWFPVQYTKPALAAPALKEFPAAAPAFHWHGDTFDLPHGATLLASSAATPNQGFLYSDRVLAFQYHLEVAAEDIAGWIKQSAQGELAPSAHVQTAEQMLGNAEGYTAIGALCNRLLDNWLHPLR